MAKLGKRAIQIIEQSMLGLSGYNAKATAAALAEAYGVSPATIYRLSEHIRPTRKPRSDAGIQRHGVAVDALELLIALVVQKGCSAELAIQIGEDPANGLIEPGAISTTLLRQLVKKETGMTFKELSDRQGRKDRPLRSNQTTHRRFGANEPNSVWVMDFSGHPQYYVDDKGLVKYASPLIVSKNHPLKAGWKRLWIYHISDAYSGVRFSLPYAASPSAHTVLDFFYEAIRNKDYLGFDFPFRGIPHQLDHDKDPAIHNKLVLPALERLDVTHKESCGNPNANARAERYFRTIKEFLRATKQDKLSLEDVRMVILDFELGYNHKPRGVDKISPFSKWLTISNIRSAPDAELYDQLFIDEFVVRVGGDLVIRLQGREWQLPDRQPFNRWANSKVIVYWSRKSANKAQVESINEPGIRHEITMAPPKTYPLEIYRPGDHFRSTAKNEQESTLDKYDSINLSTLRTSGHNLEKYSKEKLESIQPKTIETPFDATAFGPAPAPLIGRAIAINKVRLALGGEYYRLSQAEVKLLDELLPAEGATQQQIDEAVNKLVQSPRSLVQSP